MTKTHIRLIDQQYAKLEFSCDECGMKYGRQIDAEVCEMSHKHLKGVTIE